MRIQINAAGFKLTPSLQLFIEEKLGSLEKFLRQWDENNAVILRVEVSKNAKHHHKGNIFYAEVNIDLPKRVIRTEETGEGMRTVIDKLKGRLKNELLRLKERLVDH